MERCKLCDDVGVVKGKSVWIDAKEYDTYKPCECRRFAKGTVEMAQTKTNKKEWWKQER